MEGVACVYVMIDDAPENGVDGQARDPPWERILGPGQLALLKTQLDLERERNAGLKEV